MSELVDLIDVSAIPPGTGHEVTAAGRVFAVFNINGAFHVLDGICPHAGGPLGRGVLRGDVVTCPWHGWQFDVPSGQHCLNQRICQPRFDCDLVDGRVQVTLP